MGKTKPFVAELSALGTILEALDPLDDQARRFVLKTVGERLNLADALPATAPQIGLQSKSSVTPSTQTQTIGTGLTVCTPKEFLKNKKPTSDVQRIACLAFYLTHNKDQQHFKTRDLTKLNTDAAGIRLSNPAYAVTNATRQNKFLAPAGKGSKQITSLGEDIVNALPDQERVKATIAEQTAGLRKRRARKKATQKPR